MFQHMLRKVVAFHNQGQIGNDNNRYKTIFNVSANSSNPVIFERINYDLVKQNSSREVVMISGRQTRYEAGSNAGDLFMEDYCCNNISFKSGQNVWIRQFNIERKDAPNVTVNGAKLWVLGYKTESNGQGFIVNSGETEVIGGNLLPFTNSFGAFQDPVIKLSSSAKGSFLFRIDEQNGFRLGPNTIVQQDKNGQTKTLSRGSLTQICGSIVYLPLFVANDSPSSNLTPWVLND